jgi:DNA-binding transcriptional MerR regulator
MAMGFEALKVGELARRTGLTIRTLHHYDEIGVLKPSLHTEAGHRLYTAGDVARLQQVLSLRQLGLSLEEIRDCLAGPDFAPLEVVRRHLARLREQITLQKRLCDRLELLAARLESAEAVSVEEFLHTIEVMNKMEMYYTPEQMKQFEEIGKQTRPEEIRAIEEAWTALLAEVRANRDLDPASLQAQDLARRWDELTERTKRPYQAFPEVWQAIGDNYKQGRFEGFDRAPQAADFAFVKRVKAARPSPAASKVASALRGRSARAARAAQRSKRPAPPLTPLADSLRAPLRQERPTHPGYTGFRRSKARS